MEPTFHFVEMQKAPALRGAFKQALDNPDESRRLARSVMREIQRVEQEWTDRGVSRVTIGEFVSTRVFLALLPDYAEQGKQNFVVLPRVSHVLRDMAVRMMSSPEELSLDDVLLPYPSGYVALPDCPAEVYNSTTGLHPLTGIYWWWEAERSRLWLLTWGRSKNSHVDDDALQCIEFFVPPGGDNATHLMAAQCCNFDYERALQYATGADLKEEELGALYGRAGLRYAFEVLIGLCLYLDTNNREVVHDSRFVQEHNELVSKLGSLGVGNGSKAAKKAAKRRGQLQRRIDQTPPIRVTFVGPSLEKTIERVETQASADGKYRPHWVRAHRQRYRVKVNDSVEQQWRFKASFMKGTGDVAERVYKVR